jgi:hypothetical protein
MWLPPLFRPFIAPVRGSMNTRGLDTTFASCGAATGTLITSMRNSAVFGSLSGASPRAAGQLFRLAHERCARDVDIDVVLVVRIDHQRMRVRSAAGLHRCHLLRILDVGNIEDSHAAETVRAAHGQPSALVLLALLGRRRIGRKSLRAQSRRPFGISTDMNSRFP